MPPTLHPTPSQDSPTEDNIPVPATRGDKKLVAYMLLGDRIRRLQDVHVQLRSTVVNLLDNSVRASQKIREIKQLDREVIPMLGKAVSDEMPKELHQLAPIPGTAYLHKSKEARINEKARQLKTSGESMPRKRIKLMLQEQKATTRRRMILPTQAHRDNSAVTHPLPRTRAAKKRETK